MSSSNSPLPNIRDNNSQILSDIQSLQSIEANLYDSLEQNVYLSTPRQQQIVQKINEISRMRINLYETLSGVNTFFQDALENSRGTLTEQTAAIGIVEDELNKSKKRLELLEADRNNKIRLVEINGYFGQKYSEHTELMKIIIFILLPILILAMLNKNGILPNSFYYVLVMLIALIGSVFLWKKMWSIWHRDPMNYQEYDWEFNPQTAPGPNGYQKDPWYTGPVLDNCVTQSIQAGIQNVKDLQTSVGKSDFVNSTAETFVNYNSVNPSNSSSFVNYGKF